MVALLVITAILAGQLFVSSAEGTWTSSPVFDTPAFERRLFEIKSHQAWELIQNRLHELGFPPDKIDRANQLTLTDWRDVGAGGAEWLPVLAFPEQYVAGRIRFAVFVSPFAEPARVYVGSLIEARKVPSAAPGLAYNVATVNRALMGELAKALRQDGHPIPQGLEQRRQLAQSVLKNEADDCLRAGLPPPKGGRITPPQKIGLSQFEFIYPAEVLEARQDGTVQVEFTILEDGGVTDVRLLGSSINHHLEASAMGVVSLMLYKPAKINECRVPTIMRHTVRYRR